MSVLYGDNISRNTDTRVVDGPVTLDAELATSGYGDGSSSSSGLRVVATEVGARNIGNLDISYENDVKCDLLVDEQELEYYSCWFRGR